MRMLLIEDDGPFAESIELTVSSKGFDCDIDRLGEEGIKSAKRLRYDVIVLDLKLPDMDGYDVLRKLRAAKVETPVLIISGLGGAATETKGFSLGADDFMAKPFSNYDLVSRIQAIMWPCPRVQRVDGVTL